MSLTHEDLGFAAYMLIGEILDELDKIKPGSSKSIFARTKAQTQSRIAAGEDPQGNLAKYLEVLEPHFKNHGV